MATNAREVQMFVVEVLGACQTDTSSPSHYSLKVSYRSLARTLQFIKVQGGQVVRVEQVANLAKPNVTPIESPSHSQPLLESFTSALSSNSGTDLAPEPDQPTNPIGRLVGRLRAFLQGNTDEVSPNSRVESQD